MNWDVLDILTFTVMLSVVAIVLVLARRRTRSRAYNIAVAVAAAGAFLLVWINGAVGIIGDEENTANLLFFGVLAIAAAGSVIARFRAGGMAIALYATAGAQLLVAFLAIAMRLGASSPVWPRGLLFLTLLFTALWLVSGWFFSRAARAELLDRGNGVS